MKKIILSVLMIIAVTNSFCQWRKCYQGSDTANKICGASFVNPAVGFIASNKWIGYSTDSGKTLIKKYVTLGNVNFGSYTNVNLTFGFFINGVQAFSPDTVLVYGHYGFEPSILYSVNGGISWNLVYHKAIRINAQYLENSIYDMVFPKNGSIGYAVHGDEILRSANRGVSWQSTFIKNDEQMFRLTFSDQNHGYAASSNHIFQTFVGTSWQFTYYTYPNITAISCPTLADLFFVSDGYPYYSSNSGNVISKMSSYQQYPADIHFVNDSMGYATFGYDVYQSRNWGIVWEPMPKNDNFSYLGFGFNKLCFLNDSTAWACGDNDYVSITTNGGGISLPKAIFTYNTSSVCTNNTVNLVNLSQKGYSYQWLRNGVPFSTTYNASYTLTTGYDTIQLIVIKGSVSDTMTQKMYIEPGGSYAMNVIALNDSACSNHSSGAVFEILNSKTNFQYQVGRTGGYSTPVYGNGGSLFLGGGTNAGEDSVVKFTVYGFGYGPCGSVSAQVSFNIQVVLEDPPTGSLTDTICGQSNTFNVIITNSQQGYLYWIDTSFAKVPGTGNNIQVPTRLSNYLTKHTYQDSMFTNYTYGIFVTQPSLGCGGTLIPRTIVPIVDRRSRAGFYTPALELQTDDTLVLHDISKQSMIFQWSFLNGANTSSSSDREPQNVFFVQPGLQLIRQKAITKEGCIDSATSYVEVYNNTGGNTCTTPGTAKEMDSITKPNYFVSRAFYEDEFGNRIVGGGYTDMTGLSYQFYPRSYEGCFAAKYNKNGSLLWYLQNPVGDYNAIDANSHLIIEQALGDHLNNTFLLGHSFKRANFRDVSGFAYSLPPACAFVASLNSSGNFGFIRRLFSYSIATGYESLNYTGASMLRGKKDEIFVVTQRKPVANERFVSGVDVLADDADVKCGILFKYDQYGNVARSRTYPATFFNKNRWNAIESDNYDRLPPCSWDSSGHLVIYDLLDTTQMTGNKIDSVTLGFDLTKIKSVLLFIDTSNFEIVKVKPIYRNTPAGPATIQPDSYAIDSAGNYYVGYTLKEPFPISHQPYQDDDSIKYKSYVNAFDSSGNLLWQQQMVGLQPLNMLAYKNDLKVYGTNYIASGFSNEAMNAPGNTSSYDSGFHKLTLVSSASQYAGFGKKGLGSLDNVVASLNTSSGELQEIFFLGTTKEEETGTMKRGYADTCFWATGTVGLNLRNNMGPDDSTSTLKIYKLTRSYSCNVLALSAIAINVDCKSPETRIHWHTDYNNEEGIFQIQKSYDAVNWSNIAIVKSAFGKKIHSYSYDDKNDNASFAGVFYRIFFLTGSGQQYISGASRASCGGNQLSKLKIYPNPAGKVTTLQFMSNNVSNGAVKVYNTLGLLSLIQNMHVQKGSNTFSLKTNLLINGYYQVVVDLPGQPSIQGILIK